MVVLETILYISIFIFCPATFIIGLMVHDLNEINIFKFKSVKTIQEEFKFKYYFYLYFFFLLNTYFSIVFLPGRFSNFLLQKTLIKN